MHADGCLLRKPVDQTSFAMKRLLSGCRASKLLIWCQDWLQLMLKSSDALTKLSDCQAAAPDRETVRCTLAVVSIPGGCTWPQTVRCTGDLSVFRSVEAQRLSVDAGEMMLAMRQKVMPGDCIRCWCIRCTGEIVFLMTQTRWCWLCVICSLSLIANDFFRSQTVFFSSSLTFFEL